MNTTVITTERPIIQPYSHPIETGEYVICTHSIHNMSQAVSEWIDMRRPGGMIYGPPRFGKSSAIKYVSQELRNKFNGTLPIVIFKCKKHAKPNESTFFGELLLCLNHAYPKGNAFDRSGRLIDHLFSLSIKNDHKRLVLIFDEAQNLEKAHYGWLVDIYNDLYDRRIKPTFVMVGQNELSHRRNSFINGKLFQIVGRFMVNTHRFEGIRNAQQLKVCLHAYDENSEYPIGSKCSYTRYFFPVAYSHGWRLESQTSSLWTAFQEIKQKHKLAIKEISMLHLTSTIEYIMRRYQNLTEIEPHFSIALWKEAIEKSGFTESEDFINIEED